MNRILARHYDEIAERIEAIKENGWEYRSNTFRNNAGIVRSSPISISTIKDVDTIFDVSQVRVREVAIDFIQNGGTSQYNNNLMTITPNIKNTIYNNEDLHKIQFVEYLTQLSGFNLVSAKIMVNVYNYQTLPEIFNSPHATNGMKLGIEWRNHLNLKVNRWEIDNVKSLIEEHLPHLQFEIVGSYRRGLSESKNIDILMILPSNTTINNIYDKLDQYIVGRLNEYDAIFRLNDKNFAHRINIKVTTPSQWPFELLYLTGPKQFISKLQSDVVKKGAYLEHDRLFIKSPNIIIIPAGNEREIFTLIGLNYIEPSDRISN